MSAQPTVSSAFQLFLKEAPGHSGAWLEAVHKLDEASCLDKKTEEIAYIAVLAAVGLDGGIPYHVQSAKAVGATREEIISAVLLGLPAVGNKAVQALPAALQAYDGAI